MHHMYPKSLNGRKGFNSIDRIPSKLSGATSSFIFDPTGSVQLS